MTRSHPPAVRDHPSQSVKIVDGVIQSLSMARSWMIGSMQIGRIGRLEITRITIKHLYLSNKNNVSYERSTQIPAIVAIHRHLPSAMVATHAADTSA
jgi:hypothetical protein